MDASQFFRTPNYCEENVYLLCKNLCFNRMAYPDGADLFVVFISNENKKIPIWHQKASSRGDGLVVWDYHVICIQKKIDGFFPFLVWDLDANLPFPCSLAMYLSQALKGSLQYLSEFHRLFRVVHAPFFFRHFASDRRHMKDSDGNWIAQPPIYEPIVAPDGTVHNLNEYTEIKEADMLSNNNMNMRDAVFSLKLGAVTDDLVMLLSQIP